MSRVAESVGDGRRHLDRFHGRPLSDRQDDGQAPKLCNGGEERRRAAEIPASVMADRGRRGEEIERLVPNQRKPPQGAA